MYKNPPRTYDDALSDAEKTISILKATVKKSRDNGQDVTELNKQLLEAQRLWADLKAGQREEQS